MFACGMEAVRPAISYQEAEQAVLSSSLHEISPLMFLFVISAVQGHDAWCSALARHLHNEHDTVSPCALHISADSNGNVVAGAICAHLDNFEAALKPVLSMHEV